MARSKCAGHARHWFSLPGMTGVRAPACVRCGAPNPRPLSEHELDEYHSLTRVRSAPIERTPWEDLNAGEAWALHHLEGLQHPTAFAAAHGHPDQTGEIWAWLARLESKGLAERVWPAVGEKPGASFRLTPEGARRQERLRSQTGQ